MVGGIGTQKDQVLAAVKQAQESEATKVGDVVGSALPGMSKMEKQAADYAARVSGYRDTVEKKHNEVDALRTKVTRNPKCLETSTETPRTLPQALMDF